MRTKLLLALILSIAASTTAMADGFYTGLGLGVVKVEDEDQGIRFSDNTFGGRLSLGYDLSQFFALEASYVQSGTLEDIIVDENVEVEFSSTVVSLIGLMPVGDASKLLGKIGYYDGEQEVTAFGTTLDEDADGLAAGVGIRFDDPGNNLSFKIEFDWFDTDLDDLWSLGFGVYYHFGN